MFDFTKNFWRRLTGKSLQTPTATAEERRVWIRYPADLQTTYKPAGAPASSRLSARVRNISLGGVNLIGNRPFQPGELLSVELPAHDGDLSSNVLACVVHCAEEGTDEWSLGCTFSRELTDADLEAFGARRERTDAADQREWKRFPAEASARYQRVSDDNQAQYLAEVLNISATGVGLLVDQEIENGTLLSVELQNPTGTTKRSMLACVVHVSARGKKQWGLGCNFIRSLSEVDLRALV
jgi:c-di-GMP-binding flagellar brake protein YcgR